jgi:peptidoglycan-associated lipoprotein
MAHPRLAPVPLPVLMALIVLAGAVAATGCTKRPSSVQAVAPAPTPPGPAPGPQSPSLRQAAVSRPGVEARTDPAIPIARPSPPEFMAMAAVKDIHFDFDKYDVRPEDMPILDGTADWMRTNPEYLVLIAGHCDERGTNEYNLALGERRGKAALEYLTTRGVPSSRMTVVSYGEERPLCRERSEDCWHQNRRAQFLVKPR